MIKLKKLTLLLFLFILTSCSFGRPEDVTELIEPPAVEDPILKGTWQVSEIKKSKNKGETINVSVGDKLYIDKNLVALNDDYAYPPKFSSKFVNLKSYLESRSVDYDFSKNSFVKILSASQGQLYSKDFIILEKNKIAYLQNECAVILKKIDKSVNRSVIKKYAKKASKERSTTKTGEKIEKDISVLIGVRERVDNNSSHPNYYYYTYCIRIEPSKMARIEKAEHIFFPLKEEFWRLKCEPNNKTRTYNTIMAYPVKLENHINDSKHKGKYKFLNDDIDLKINYVNEDYVSFDYTLVSDKLPVNKYAVLRTDEISKDSFLTINEFTGDDSSKQTFKDIIFDQISKNISSVDKDKISYDFTNFGFIRNLGLWQLQSTYQMEKDDNLEQKSFSIDITLKEDLINQDNKDLTIDKVKNINSQAKDYFELANSQYVAVQTPDEILFYSIKNGLIDPNPRVSIQLSNSTDIIMFEQGLGSYAEKWEKYFNDNNIIIH
ncbi:MAG: hypothetical protein E6Z21_01315 [Anaerococcus vaginalis]|nr:hypothetical protein [Anaerococcus vaginalis]